MIRYLTFAVAALIGATAVAEAAGEECAEAFGKGLSTGDLTEAYYVCRPFAEAGHARSQFALGLIYEDQFRDYAAAMEWWRRAAAQGFAHAMGALGRIWGDGLAVSPDHVLAYMWYDLAASAHPPGAARDRALHFRDDVGGWLTPAEISRAKELARDFRARNPY